MTTSFKLLPEDTLFGVEELSDVYPELKETLENHDRQLEELRSKLARHSSQNFVQGLDTGAFKAEFQAVKDRVIAAEQTVMTLRGELEQMKMHGEVMRSPAARDGTVELNSRISAFEGNLMTLKADTNTVNSRITTIEGNLMTLKGHQNALDSRISVVETTVISLQGECERKVSTIGTQFAKRITDCERALEQVTFPSQSMREIKCPLKTLFFAPTPLDGIIARLTQEHGGNVHDKNIVTITSQSILMGDPVNSARNVADLTTDSRFCSRGEPEQWICWDFRTGRVRPTAYTIVGDSPWIMSWIVESSMDGGNWREIDRQTDSEALRKNLEGVSFPVSKSDECRFIRLTQTGPTCSNDHYMAIRAFEIFGTLRVRRE
jgi:predicted  nucleic acid-binding Zn-ribbon protein